MFKFLDTSFETNLPYIGKQSQCLCNTSDMWKLSGVCVIDYEQVQVTVNAKCHAWQRDILSWFRFTLGIVMKEMQILKQLEEY